MKSPTLLVSLTLVACIVTSHVAASDSKLQWFPYPYQHHHRGWPFHGALPPMPHHALPYQPDPKVTKCLSHGGEIRSCITDIVTAFFTKKAAIGSQCCKAIQAIDEDCEKTVFGCFNNPFFNAYVKLHCSSNAPPSAPTPA